MNIDIRFKQRFYNFSKAFLLLKSALDNREIESFSDLEQISSVIQNHKNITKAVIFGSRAKGNYKKY
jgi:hypothetical protein